MDLRETRLKDEAVLDRFYRKVIDTVSLQENYLILLGCDSYDVPFKSKDDQQDAGRSDETFTFLLCAVCPVKQTQPKLHYVPEEKSFHDGGMTQNCSAPELGFLFPAFDNRATNIYNALFYTRSPKEGHNNFIDAVFNVQAPKPAYEQKRTFEALLTTELGEECSMDVVQTVHENLCQSIQISADRHI